MFKKRFLQRHEQLMKDKEETQKELERLANKDNDNLNKIPDFSNLNKIFVNQASILENKDNNNEVLIDGTYTDVEE